MPEGAVTYKSKVHYCYRSFNSNTVRQNIVILKILVIKNEVNFDVRKVTKY